MDFEPSSTIKVPTGYGNLYIIVTEDDKGNPIRLFCTIGKSGNAIMAKAEAIGRLVSLALKYKIPLNDIIDQLIDIGSDDGAVPWKDSKIKSIPDAVAKVLMMKYRKERKPPEDFFHDKDK